MTKLLLFTKLIPAHVQSGIITRPRLINQLDESLTGKISLISAPAGFGKTTLLAEWIRENNQTGRFSIAWFTVDEQDNDPVQFLTYLVTALQQAHPAVGQTALSRLQSAEPVPAETILALIITNLTQVKDKICLILDDYHLIGKPEVHKALTFFLEHVPPNLHLVIGSRSDPPIALSRWRVRGELQEIRAAQLRFTPTEINQFLSQILAYPLEPSTIDILADRTEGWPAGLRLVALSLRGLDEIATKQFIADFHGTHHFVFQYLVNEVIERQSPELQQFMLHTAILNRLNASLCAALLQSNDDKSGNSDPHLNYLSVQEKLEYMANNNLFLIPLDESGRWFRHHHLFSEALLARLQETQPEIIPNLHRRAGHWYATQGYTSQAIQHALAAQDMDMAAVLIDSVADQLWPQGHLGLLISWFNMLSPDVYHRHLSLILLYAWLLFLHDRWDEAGQQIQLAQEHLDSLSDGNPEKAKFHGRWAAIQGAMAAHRQDPAQMIAWMTVALEDLPAEDIHWRQVTMIGLGLAQLTKGQAQAAIKTFHQSALDCEKHEDIYLAFAAWWHQLEACWAQGRLHGVADCLHRLEMLAESDSGSGLNLADNAAIGWGMLAYERNNLEQAQEQLSNALPQIWPGGQPRVVLQAYLSLAQVAQAQGHKEVMQQHLDSATQLVQKYNLEAEQMKVAAISSRLYLAEGQLPEAQWQLDIIGISRESPADYRHEVGLLTLVRLHLAELKAEEALALLSRLLPPAEQTGREGSLLEIYLLQALAFAKLQQPQKALTRLQKALSQAESEKFGRIFINEGRPMTHLLLQIEPRTSYVAHLLSQIETLPAVVNLLDPLTDREIEILGLIANGATNQDIADQLFISVGTVKGHINHILGKMDARNRTEAVAFGRQWGLLP